MTAAGAFWAQQSGGKKHAAKDVCVSDRLQLLDSMNANEDTQGCWKCIIPQKICAFSNGKRIVLKIGGWIFCG